MKTYYAYKITDKNTGEFYYGSRSYEGDIENDTYMGSMVTWKPNEENLIKEIIRSDFKNRDELLEFESNLISKHIKNPLNRNYHIPSKTFHNDGSEGMLFKNRKILLEKAKEYGVEIKSRWGIEEQEELYNKIHNIKPDDLNSDGKIKISFTKLDKPSSKTSH